MSEDAVGFGGSDEVGYPCGCGKMVKTPFCPWCGMRIDDAGGQLLVYIEKLANQNEQSADTKEKQGDRYPNARSDLTAARLRTRAEQQRRWAAWVRSKING